MYYMLMMHFLMARRILLFLPLAHRGQKKGKEHSNMHHPDIEITALKEKEERDSHHFICLAPMVLFIGLTSHSVTATHLGDAQPLSQDHSPNTAGGDGEGSSLGSSKRGRLHVAHCVQSQITARSDPVRQHRPAA